MTPSMTNWTAVLDTLERQLHRQERALRTAGDMPNILILERPDDVMSATEEIRAHDLLQRHDSLITETLALMKRSRPTSKSPYG